MIPVDLPPPDHRPACIAPAWRADRPNTTDSITSDTYPIKVHWRRAQDANRAAVALEAAELSWAIQVEQLGFQPPVLPDDEDGPELDIYFAGVGEWEAYTEPGDYVDSQPGDGRNSTSAHIVIDRNLPIEWVPSYTAHEFNHVVQFATDYSEDSLPIWEAVAVASQHWTLGREEGAWDWDVSEFQVAPWAPALLADGYQVSDELGGSQGFLYEYGAALWVMHIDEVLGAGDGSAGAELWDATANEGWQYEPDPLDAVQTVTGQSLGEFMNALARTRWLTGDRWDDRGLAVAPEWDADEAVPVALTLDAEAVGGIHQPAVGPMITGTVFAEIDVEVTDEPLVVGVSSASGNQTGLMVMTWGSAGPVDYEASGLAPEVTVPATGVERVVVAISNLGPEDFDGEDDPWVQGDQQLHLGWGEVDLPDPGDPNGDGPRVGACGCASGAGGPWWFALVLVAGFRRRS